MKALDVGIVGCGTAGPAAALFLARAGHRVTLYERVTQPGPNGAGIILQPTGLSVLKRLGLRDAVVSRGSKLESLHCTTIDKKPIVALSYRDLGEHVYGVGAHRGMLFDFMFNAVCRQSGVDLKLGVGVASLEPLSNGRHAIVDDRGHRHAPHDLVLVADGARARLGEDHALCKNVTAYPYGALWFVGRDDEHRFTTRLHQVVRGTQRMLGLLPTGFGPGSAITPLVSLFWSIAADRVDAWRAAGLSAWKDEVLTMNPAADVVLDQITSLDQVLFTGYHDVQMTSWNTRSVVYLGDAAHATSPQLGQGCNLALYDAMVLSDCLAADEHVGAALEKYSRARRSHLGFYQFATRWLTPLFQSDHTWLGPPRDLAMGIASQIPIFNRIMANSMAGVMTGPLSWMPIPEH